MELEMKLAIKDEAMAAEIWQDISTSSIADQSSAETLVMKAVYFDTEDHILSQNNVTIRVRVEGDNSFATLKWGGSVHDGFHERREVNVPINGEAYFIQPPIDMFKESEEGLDLMSLTGDRPLINLLETRFLRRRIKLDYKGTLIELAVDTGSIITDNGETPICELELELYMGDEYYVKELGNNIAEKYGITAENRSKFARGLALLSQNS